MQLLGHTSSVGLLLSLGESEEHDFFQDFENTRSNHAGCTKTNVLM